MTRFAVRVQPGAKADQILGWMIDAQGNQLLKLKLRAPALEGKANAALIDFLAESLGIHPRQVLIEKGEKSRAKIIVVEGLTLDEIMQKTWYRLGVRGHASNESGLYWTFAKYTGY